VAQKY
jgi:hypothetical protein